MVIKIHFLFLLNQINIFTDYNNVIYIYIEKSGEIFKFIQKLFFSPKDDEAKWSPVVQRLQNYDIKFFFYKKIKRHDLKWPNCPMVSSIAWIKKCFSFALMVSHFAPSYPLYMNVYIFIWVEWSVECTEREKVMHSNDVTLVVQRARQNNCSFVATSAVSLKDLITYHRNFVSSVYSPNAHYIINH